MRFWQRVRTAIGCDFGLHRYAPWVDGATYKTRFRNTDFGAGIIDGIPYWIEAGHVMTQTSTCEDCGMKRSREVQL